MRISTTPNVVYKRAARTNEPPTLPTLRTYIIVYLNNVII
jgi:hypothetical protein